MFGIYNNRRIGSRRLHSDEACHRMYYRFNEATDLFKPFDQHLHSTEHARLSFNGRKILLLVSIIRQQLVHDTCVETGVACARMRQVRRNNGLVVKAKINAISCSDRAYTKLTVYQTAPFQTRTI